MIKPILNDKLYQILKWTVQLALPAIGTLYYTLGEIWGYEGGAEFLASITAVCTFLGVVLGISGYNYNRSDRKYDGVMRVSKTESGQLFDLELNKEPLDLGVQKEVQFKVDRGIGDPQ